MTQPLFVMVDIDPTQYSLDFWVEIWYKCTLHLVNPDTRQPHFTTSVPYLTYGEPIIMNVTMTGTNGGSRATPSRPAGASAYQFRMLSLQQQQLQQRLDESARTMADTNVARRLKLAESQAAQAKRDFDRLSLRHQQSQRELAVLRTSSEQANAQLTDLSAKSQEATNRLNDLSQKHDQALSQIEALNQQVVAIEAPGSPIHQVLASLIDQIEEIRRETRESLLEIERNLRAVP